MRLLPVACFTLSALAILAGCGGGGSAGLAGTTGGTGGGTTGGATPRQSNVSATFTVDVNTGKVKIINYSKPLAGKIFNGNAISFTSSLLTDLPGDLGTKVLNVSITNNSGIDLGSLPNGNTTGFKVMFGPMFNLTGLANVAAQTNVTTFAGSTVGFGDGPLLNAKFSGLCGVAVDPSGTLYVADTTNCRIRKIQNGRVTTLAGNGAFSSVDGNGTAASIYNPFGLAYDPVDQSLIVADTAGRKVRRVTLDGRVRTIAGTGVYGFANGPGTTATFGGPYGVAVDSNGVIYVSDNNRIRTVTFNSGDRSLAANYTVGTLSGTGTAGYLDGPGATAQFSIPEGLACDSKNNLYVADFANNVIRRVDPSGYTSTIAGIGAASETDGFGNVATLNGPAGIAILANTLYVSDANGEKIRQLTTIDGIGATPSAWLVSTLAGTGATGFTNGVGYAAMFHNPNGIAVSGGSNIYLADTTNGVIRKLTPNTGFFPIGVATGTTSGDAVQLSNADGVIPNSGLGTNLPYIEYSQSVANGATSTPRRWSFSVPHGVTSFQFNVTVEADTDSATFPQGATGVGSPYVDVRTLSGTGSSGYVNGSSGESQFGSQGGVAVDAQGIVYIGDSVSGAIRRVDQFGNSSTIAGTRATGLGNADGPGNTASVVQPYGLVVNAAGTEIFVVDYGNNNIRRIVLTGLDPTNPASWTVSTVAGGGGAGIVEGAGTVAKFNQPVGIAMSSGGILYVTEFAGNRVRKLEFQGGDRSQAANWLVSLVAGDDSATAGATGTANGQGNAARFTNPNGIGCDRNGNVFVADANNGIIRKIDPLGNVTTFAGNGSFGYADGSAPTAVFNAPTSLCVDGAGYVYTGDQYEHMIRRVSPSGNVESIAGVNNSQGATDGPGSVAKFSGLPGMAISASGVLYVFDSNRIRIVQRVLSTSSN